jgi:hypothetical protein
MIEQGAGLSWLVGLPSVIHRRDPARAGASTLDGSTPRRAKCELLASGYFVAKQ